MGTEGVPQGVPGAGFTPQGLPAETPAPSPERKMPKIELPTLSPEYEQLQRTLDEVAESDPASIAEAIQIWLAEDERRNG
jgi:flagellar biosynthesis/type III secretory pathway M-ring protein FliF/YscJ